MFFGVVAQLGVRIENAFNGIYTASGEVLLLSKGTISDRREITKRVTEQLRKRELNLLFWGCSSVGRANGSQSLGRGFDPLHLHQ